jgi:predicted small metal-binding protein
VKSIKCRDMGMDCGFVAEGETAEEVKAKLTEHAGTVHADMMASMSEEDTAKMMADIDAKLA